MSEDTKTNQDPALATVVAAMQETAKAIRDGTKASTDMLQYFKDQMVEGERKEGHRESIRDLVDKHNELSRAMDRVREDMSQYEAGLSRLDERVRHLQASIEKITRFLYAAGAGLAVVVWWLIQGKM